MVYSEVVKSGSILPKKSRYTKKDYNKLVKEGKNPREARFICITSAMYHGGGYSKFFDSINWM